MTEKPKPEPHLPLPLGTALVLKADSRELPFADDTVDLVVTSPPYFALRSYQDGGQHYDGQIGDEPTPAEFVASLLEVTRECMRVLKPSGSLWVNLGDKYNAYNGNRGKGKIQDNEPRQSVPGGHGLDVKGVRPKSLIGIPWRYALACIDDLGLILRAEVVWSKPNGLPESVTDRVRRSHEQWFHFTLQPRYFSAVDEIREPHVGGHSGLAATQHRTDRASVDAANPLGKLPGSVWTVPTEPLRVPDHLGIDHFAAFPTEWPRRIIAGFAPLAGICTECGEGRRPVTKAQRTIDGEPAEIGGWKRGGVQEETAGVGNWRFGTERAITGYACKCPEPTAPTTPAVILDPFGGTGTTALVAKALGACGVSVDMSSDYTRLAEWRTTDPDQLSRVQCQHVYGVRKPTKKQIREREAALADSSDSTPDPGPEASEPAAEPDNHAEPGPSPNTTHATHQ
jgi:DNA modification methylase